MKPLLLTFIGTRPEIIKMSSLIPRFDREFRHVLVHSGQHYSPEMDRVFFRQLELRKPDFNLRAGSHQPAAQIGAMMAGLERIVLRLRPDGILVQGDTNTALAGALVAAKHKASGMKLFHVEALLRSGNLAQPEEVNRILIDQVSDRLFAVHRADESTARREGIPASRVVWTGNTLADACLRMASRIPEDEAPAGLSLEPGAYALATVHRQSTVDSPAVLRGVLEALSRVSERVPVVFPMHPRTRARVRALGWRPPRGGALTVLGPLGYRETIALLKSARFCLTDSGGLLEEAAILGIPALILRHEVEQKAFVRSGLHALVPPGRAAILRAAEPLIRSDAEIKRRSKRKPRVSLGADRRILAAIRRAFRG